MSYTVTNLVPTAVSGSTDCDKIQSLITTGVGAQLAKYYYDLELMWEQSSQGKCTCAPRVTWANSGNLTGGPSVSDGKALLQQWNGTYTDSNSVSYYYSLYIRFIKARDKRSYLQSLGLSCACNTCTTITL